jgi:hypothetical protein
MLRSDVQYLVFFDRILIIYNNCLPRDEVVNVEHYSNKQDESNLIEHKVDHASW